MRAGMFIGVESYNWKAADFTFAANRLKLLGLDTLIVKVADGVNLWYGGWNGIQERLDAVKQTGMKVLPFLYSYGNQFNGLNGEIAIANMLFHLGYEVCFDMETQWNNQEQWAKTLVSKLNYKIWVSTWGDPALQGWNKVLGILKPKTRYFLPQIYTPYLEKVWRDQYKAVGIDLNQIILTVNSQTLEAARGRVAVTMWEYKQLGLAEIKQVIDSLAVPAPPPAPAPDYQGKQMVDVWNSTSFLFQGFAPPFYTGIAEVWKKGYRRGKIYGPPVTREFDTVDWKGVPIVRQEFKNDTWIEWYKDGKSHVYRS